MNLIYVVEYMSRRYWSTLATITSSYSYAYQYIKDHPDFGGEISKKGATSDWVISQYEVDKEDPRLIWHFDLQGECTMRIDDVTKTKICEACKGRQCIKCGEVGYHPDSCVDCSTCNGLGIINLEESEISKAEKDYK